MAPSAAVKACAIREDREQSGSRNRVTQKSPATAISAPPSCEGWNASWRPSCLRTAVQLAALLHTPQAVTQAYLIGHHQPPAASDAAGGLPL
jgi:hypothetical protein